MTRKSIIKSAYGFNINDDFWKSVDNFVIGNFLLDSKNGDLTSEFLIDNRQKSSAQIVAKSNGVFAGRMELEYFLRNSKNSLNCMCCVDDGKSFKSGDVLIEVEGKTCEILVFERTILNLLMRMSGIATYVNSLCENLDEEVYLAATRKTLWGVLDKKAVETGGGLSHRINLSDGIMVKDTHLDFYSRDFARIFSSIESNVEKLRGARFIEIEIEKLEEFDAVYSLSKDFLLRHSELVLIIMFDNMEPEQISFCLSKISKSSFLNLLFEASGGINESNYVEYAKSGVDVISMSCLTQGVKSSDFSLKILPK